MKTRNLQLLIIVLLYLYPQTFYAQDTPSTRIATSYEAETYYLYNKQSNKGRLGWLTANKDGIATFSNNYPIRFAFNDEHDYFINIDKVSSDALLYSDRTNWFRIGSNGGLALWGSGGYKGTLPNLFIAKSGYVGINTTDGTERLHLKNGNFLLDQGAFYNKRTVNSAQMQFKLDLTTNKSGYWMGTETKHSLTIGTEGKGSITIFPEGHSLIYRHTDDNNVNINKEYLDMFSLFVLGGIFTEDIAIGPQSMWADHVFTENYELKPLVEVETFIKENNHLPDIPSAEQVRNEGYNLHEMNVKLLEKVEELTLHLIRQEKEIQELKKQHIPPQQ